MYPRVTYIGSPVSSRIRHWLNPFYMLTNLLFFCVFFPCLKSSRVSWHPDNDAWFSRHSKPGQPLIFYTWHAYSWWFISAVLKLSDQQRPAGISNDSVMSRMNSGSSTWCGVDLVEFKRGATTAPRDQIVDFMRKSGRSIMIFPDAGGPYGRIKPGLIAIARAAPARIVPVVLDVRPRLAFGFSTGHLLPVPFARLRVRLGEPLDATDANPEKLALALDALEKANASDADA